MNKVLVSKEKIEKIAEFINWSIDCDYCPIADKCWNSNPADCKKMIADYLMGDNEK